MKHLGTVVAIALGTALLVMLIAVPVEAKQIVKIHPITTVDDDVDVDVWTDREQGAIYNTGDPINIYFNANQDCYVTIYDIDTDGNVKILFPEYPDDGFVYGGVTYRLPDYYERGSLYVSGPHGIEYISAVASLTPGAFRYKPRMKRYHMGVDPVTGDPFVAINSINQRMIATEHISATATTYFFVGNRVWYPRYMCKSCHGGTTIISDPYNDECPRYSVRIAGSYDYWWGYEYYPARTRYVFGGPFWSFEIRTGPYYRRNHYKHIDIAYGYHNYYCPTPPRRPYRHAPIVTTRTVYREKQVRDYSPVTYGNIRTGDGARTRDGARSRTTVTGRGSENTRSRSSRDYGNGSTSRSRTSTVDTDNSSSRSRSGSGTNDTYNGTSTRSRSTHEGSTGNEGVTTRSRTTNEGGAGTESTTTTRSRTWYESGTGSGTGSGTNQGSTRTRTGSGATGNVPSGNAPTGGSTNRGTIDSETGSRSRSSFENGATGGSTNSGGTSTGIEPRTTITRSRSSYENGSTSGGSNSGSVNSRSGYDNGGTPNNPPERSRSSYDNSSTSTSSWSTTPSNDGNSAIRSKPAEPIREQNTRVEPQTNTRSRESVTPAPQREPARAPERSAPERSAPERTETSTIRVPSASSSETGQSRSASDAQSSGSDSRSRQQSSSSSSSTSSRTRTR